MKQTSLDKFGLRAKIKTKRISQDKLGSQIRESKRGKKAAAVGKETEELVKKELGLEKNKAPSPDLIGLIDEESVGVEIKHSQEKDVIIWYNQLVKIHNTRKKKTLDGKTIKPYYAIVFTKQDGEKIMYLVPTSELLKLAEGRMRRTKWGLRKHEKELLKVVTNQTKPLPFENEEEIRAMEKDRLERLERKLKKPYFRVNEEELKTIARKIIKLMR